MLASEVARPPPGVVGLLAAGSEELPTRFPAPEEGISPAGVPSENWNEDICSTRRRVVRMPKFLRVCPRGVCGS